MPSLRELQRGFTAAALFGDMGALAEVGVVAGQLDPAARIAVYRNNVLGNYRRALAATYPVLRRLVGGPIFDAAIVAFVRAHPSRHGDVNRYGGELARFLETYPPAREPPYLPDIARLEWAIDQANIAADAAALDLAALAAVRSIGSVNCALHCTHRHRSLDRGIRYSASGRSINPVTPGMGRVDPGEGGDALLVRRASDGVTISNRVGARPARFPGGSGPRQALGRRRRARRGCRCRV